MHCSEIKVGLFAAVHFLLKTSFPVCSFLQAIVLYRLPLPQATEQGPQPPTIHVYLFFGRSSFLFTTCFKTVVIVRPRLPIALGTKICNIK